MHPSLERVEHRPWPCPDRPWAWRQSWRDLLLAHWRVAPSFLRPLVPPSLEIEEMDGSAWIGVVPFRVRGAARWPLPRLPFTSFPELHLRLYVTRDDRPGVFFLGLEAGSRLAVEVGRRRFHLPYAHAFMHADIAPDGVRYRSVRAHADEPVVFEAVYRATSPPRLASPETLEYRLAERYCFYARSRSGALYRAQVHHVPFGLQEAEAVFHENGLLRPHGLAVEGDPALLHFTRRLDVLVWSPEKLPE